MSYQFFINPTKETICANILKTILENQTVSEIKEIISKIEETDFDFSKESFIFDDKEYGVVKR